MGPADTLSHLIDPDTSSDNNNITLLPDDLFIRALDTTLVPKITSSTLTDPLVLDALKSLSTGSPLFPRSSLTDWHFSDSHLYFKTIFISLLMLRGPRNLISSSAHSGVVRRHRSYWTLGSSSSDNEKSARLRLLLGVPRERLDYWQIRRRTS